MRERVSFIGEEVFPKGVEEKPAGTLICNSNEASLQ